MRWSLALLMMAACTADKAGAGPCSGNGECSPGEVCTSSGCVRLCRNDFDCTSGQVCDTDVCGPGARQEPRIISVDGAGTPDGAIDHGAHHVERRVTVAGENLDGASVTVGDVETEVCERTSSSLVFELPESLAPGDYALTVANQAGSCAGTLSVLQGERGDGGPPGPRPDVQLGGGLLGTGAAGDGLRIEFAGNGSASTAARSDHTHPIADASIEGRHIATAAISATHLEDVGITTNLARAVFPTVTGGTLDGAGPGGEASTVDMWRTNVFPSSLTFDFGGLVYSVNEISFDASWRGDGRFSPAYTGAGAYVLETSTDGATWTAIPPVAPTTNGSTFLHRRSPTELRFVRLTVNAPNIPANPVQVTTFRIMSPVYGDATKLTVRRLLGNTCVFQQTCAPGLADRGQAGFVLESTAACQFTSGAAFSAGWNWCYPRLCCNF